MKSLASLTISVLILCLLASSSSAAFTNIYVFGDSLSATDDTITPAPGSTEPASFHGLRWSNGRVWVEVLAQLQGIILYNTNNKSYFDHNSSILKSEINSFPVADATNSLFVVWVCNADTFDAAQNKYNSSQWNNAINLAMANHLNIITNLYYSKGARTMLLPNAVDISKIPAFNGSANIDYLPLTSTMSSGCLNYNAALSNTINQAKSLCPDLKIYTPDFFSLMNDVLTNASKYGLTNALDDNGLSIDAYSDVNIISLNISNCPGTNYIFWDQQDPSAKLHYTMGGIANAMLSPPVITSITRVNGSNRLDIASLPVATVDATNCLVLYATNLNQTVWQTNLPGFTSLTATQTNYVPILGQQCFYRIKSNLAFHWPWVWP